MSHFRSDIRQRCVDIVALYPQPRSAMLPLLHLAQEQDGYVSDEGIAEVAELTNTTPADVRGTASFYDMFHLDPVGRHLVEVCTNLSCALSGAQRVVEAFEQELGVEAGGTTVDGEVTLGLVECLGGCGSPTVVAVDHRYRHDVRPDGVAEIVRELLDRT